MHSSSFWLYCWLLRYIKKIQTSKETSKTIATKTCWDLTISKKAERSYSKKGWLDVQQVQTRAFSLPDFSVFVPKPEKYKKPIIFDRMCSAVKIVSHFHKLNLHLCFFNGWFWWMFFNSIKETNRLRKEINRLISKGMPNIYLTVTIEKSWLSQNFDFRNLKDLLPSQFLGSSNSSRYHWNLKLLVATWKSEIWKEN